MIPFDHVKKLGCAACAYDVQLHPLSKNQLQGNSPLARHSRTETTYANQLSICQHMLVPAFYAFHAKQDNILSLKKDLQNVNRFLDRFLLNSLSFQPCFGDGLRNTVEKGSSRGVAPPAGGFVKG
ncbi:hypothetical protein E2542_SST19773 [Spatholobus suberectus]|nr:hypothetical protein E2542_SST19773 [Spatholobus suberectus]